MTSAGRRNSNSTSAIALAIAVLFVLCSIMVPAPPTAAYSPSDSDGYSLSADSGNMFIEDILILAIGLLEVSFVEKMPVETGDNVVIITEDYEITGAKTWSENTIIVDGATLTVSNDAACKCLILRNGGKLVLKSTGEGENKVGHSLTAEEVYLHGEAYITEECDCCKLRTRMFAFENVKVFKNDSDGFNGGYISLISDGTFTSKSESTSSLYDSDGNLFGTKNYKGTSESLSGSVNFAAFTDGTFISIINETEGTESTTDVTDSKGTKYHAAEGAYEGEQFMDDGKSDFDMTGVSKTIKEEQIFTFKTGEDKSAPVLDYKVTYDVTQYAKKTGEIPSLNPVAALGCIAVGMDLPITNIDFTCGALTVSLDSDVTTTTIHTTRTSGKITTETSTTASSKDAQESLNGMHATHYAKSNDLVGFTVEADSVENIFSSTICINGEKTVYTNDFDTTDFGAFAEFNGTDLRMSLHGQNLSSVGSRYTYNDDILVEDHKYNAYVDKGFAQSIFDQQRLADLFDLVSQLDILEKKEIHDRAANIIVNSSFDIDVGDMGYTADTITHVWQTIEGTPVNVADQVVNQIYEVQGLNYRSKEYAPNPGCTAVLEAERLAGKYELDYNLLVGDVKGTVVQYSMGADINKIFLHLDVEPDTLASIFKAGTTYLLNGDETGAQTEFTDAILGTNDARIEIGVGKVESGYEHKDRINDKYEKHSLYINAGEDQTCKATINSHTSMDLANGLVSTFSLSSDFPKEAIVSWCNISSNGSELSGTDIKATEITAGVDLTIHVPISELESIGGNMNNITPELALELVAKYGQFVSNVRLDLDEIDYESTGDDKGHDSPALVQHYVADDISLTGKDTFVFNGKYAGDLNPNNAYSPLVTLSNFTIEDWKTNDLFLHPEDLLKASTPVMSTTLKDAHLTRETGKYVLTCGSATVTIGDGDPVAYEGEKERTFLGAYYLTDDKGIEYTTDSNKEGSLVLIVRAKNIAAPSLDSDTVFMELTADEPDEVAIDLSIMDTMLKMLPSKTSTIEFRVNTVGADGDEIMFTADALYLLSRNNEGVTIKSNEGTVVLDGESISTLYRRSGADNLGISINTYAKDDLEGLGVSEKLRGYIGNSPVISVSNDAGVHQLNGTMKITIPYASEWTSNTKVYYIDADNGKAEIVKDYSYDPASKTVTFSVNHMSLFTVSESTFGISDSSSATGKTSNDDPILMVSGCALVIVLIAGLAYFIGAAFYSARKGNA